MKQPAFPNVVRHARKGAYFRNMAFAGTGMTWGCGLRREAGKAGFAAFYTLCRGFGDRAMRFWVSIRMMVRTCEAGTPKKGKLHDRPSASDNPLVGRVSVYRLATRSEEPVQNSDALPILEM
jgi:hypothetical protein